MARISSWFHWRDGNYFRRCGHGVVEMKRVEEGAGDVVIRIPRNEWASIIAHVSEPGDTAEQFQRAQAFHDAPQRFYVAVPWWNRLRRWLVPV